jgi:hypothetical protein
MITGWLVEAEVAAPLVQELLFQPEDVVLVIRWKATAAVALRTTERALNNKVLGNDDAKNTPTGEEVAEVIMIIGDVTAQRCRAQQTHTFNNDNIEEDLLPQTIEGTVVTHRYL